jgi:hypothetical protein
MTSNTVNLPRAEYDALIEDRRALKAVHDDGACLVVYMSIASGGLRASCSKADAAELVGAELTESVSYWKERHTASKVVETDLRLELDTLKNAPPSKTETRVWIALNALTWAAIAVWGWML